MKNDIKQPDKIKTKSLSELMEAFKKEGCAICRLNYLNVDSYFSSILYECVNDPAVRKKIRNSLGYCKDHSTHFIQFIEGSYNRFGASIMVEDIVKELIKKVESLSKLSLKEIKKVNPANTDCPACTYQSKCEEIYYSEIAGNLSNENFFNLFLESDGLCFSHLLGLLKVIKSNEFKNKILENQKGKLAGIIRDLNAFVKKHTQEGKGKISPDEAGALKKAIRKITGE